MKTHALVLFAHGARDPRWAEPFKRLQQIIQAQQPDLTVSLAFLELMEPRLPALTAELEASGHTQITVVPVFFGQGGHVLRDLPLILDELRQKHPEMTVKAVPAVGEDEAVLNAIAAYCIGSLARQ
ncbi:sirohydrochlorin cobaltochelatase [Noviherbaspirillum humi]|uniref:Sirohydrochlorin cobaltochelatase n=1 Tax=Noviherbaspirillum humi TaxID=1688639 RepID=A0A239GNI1_9BURK|nr:CbiX/SirB N-terminal domain-containing protein [Noviherbaspirillum humi]SNS70759.1 sirohydrochlorin cobaltochelatase [Noviherbaspirillum humi]